MEIRKYLALLRYWAWLIVLVTLITGSTAYIINKQTEPVYSSEALLMIDLAPGTNYSDLLVEQRLTQTYIELIKTREIRQMASDRLEASGVKIESLDVNFRPNTTIIVVRAQHTDPEAAAMVANTISDVFITRNELRQSERYDESIQFWDDQMSALEIELSDIESQIQVLGDAEDAESLLTLSQLDRRLREVQFSYEDAFTERENLKNQAVQDTDSVSIIQPAEANRNAVSPRVLSNTLLATIIGAMLALGLVFLLEYLDDSVKSPDQLQEELGLNTLGAIAYIRGDTAKDRLITFNTPRAPISEAYRVLRTNISFSAIDDGMRTLLVTSSSPSEGKSTTTANLSVAIAQTGKRVITVDADLRRPSQHKIFEVPNNQGLTTALLDSDTPVAYHIQNTKVPGLRILTSGPLPPNPAELLNSQRMEQIIDMLKQEADVIVFDTPPTMTVADASILAPRVAGCLLVVQLGNTKMEAIASAAERMRQSGAVLFGTVLNQMRPGRSGYYDYYYYYRYYAYEYSSQRPKQRRGLLGRLPRFSRS